MIPSFRPGIISSNRIRAAGGGVDVTPNAINWADVNTEFTAITTMQQITGISQNITLTVSWTGQETGGGFYYNINSTNTYNSSSEIALTSSPTSITISNGQYLGFRLVTVSVQRTRAVTVTNSSDGNAAIDTFTLTASPAAP